MLQHRDALSYGETLLHLAELSLEARPLAAAVGILHWQGELERRIAGLLAEGRSTMTRSNRWLACVVAVLFLVSGAIASSTRFTADREVTPANTLGRARTQRCEARAQSETNDAGPRPGAGRSADGRGQGSSIGLDQEAGRSRQHGLRD